MHLWYIATAESGKTTTAMKMTTTVNQQTSATNGDSPTVAADATTVTDTDSQTNTGKYKDYSIGAGTDLLFLGSQHVSDVSNVHLYTSGSSCQCSRPVVYYTTLMKR